MNLINKIAWKTLDIFSVIYGFQNVDYINRENKSKWKKIYTIFVSIAFCALGIQFGIEIKDDFTTKSFINYVFFLIFTEESIIVVNSILTEFFFNNSKNNHVSAKIHSIDKHMKINDDVKLKFKLKLTFVYIIFYIFMVCSILLDLKIWGNTYLVFLMTCKIRSVDFILFKFMMIVHLHLCRLCLMNDHLKQKLNLKRKYGKSSWLYSWKLYPKNIEIDRCVEDFDVFMFIYSNLCENVAFVSKKFKIFVSKILNNDVNYVNF